AEVLDDGRKVVIENQLGPSDHDHLGKSIAYAAGVDADIIVWIAPKFNDEHSDAIQWLNENSQEGVDIFAIKLEVWKIGESQPAPRFNPIEKPSEWKEKAQRGKGELSEIEELREEYWTKFRNLIEKKSQKLSSRKPRTEHWYNSSIGKTGFTVSFNINSRDNELKTQLIIRDDAEAYKELAEEKDEIEKEFQDSGYDLVWNKPEKTRAGKKRSKIAVARQGNIKDKEKWDEYLDWMFNTGEKFHEVFYDRIQRL
ncbi:MAG: DUF4268 domain-containing protein, partial [Halobacteria archaeon]|nr:DUF4268 domain-containing protein [Halobacteria archaeon]